MSSARRARGVRRSRGAAPRGVRAGLAAAAACAALALGACGGATVDTAEIEAAESASSEAPAESSSAEKSAPESESGRRGPDHAPNPRATERDVNDPGATRADSAPDNRMPLTKEDERFLDALEADGIAVDGTEDQLIGAGHAHCGPDGALVNAVAGQLVTQGRTDKSPEDAARVIADAADAAYC
ncbi:DUF732 domain-containing protein [Corynebacterium sp. 335C]